ncbi:MAG TPA: hypothetical protein VLQ68_03100 [Rhizobiaceae bacterium]|nr:hypothetical protein [Rhizobiaceae bacterium]
MTSLRRKRIFALKSGEFGSFSSGALDLAVLPAVLPCHSWRGFFAPFVLRVHGMARKGRSSAPEQPGKIPNQTDKKTDRARA